jgi:hypothetical protein
LAVGRVRTKSKSNPAMAAERRMDDFLVMIWLAAMLNYINF